MYESRNKREGRYAERNVRGHQTSKKWFANCRTRGLKSRRILDNAIATRERANEQNKRARIVSDAFIGELLKNATQVKVQLVESVSITRGTLGKYPKKKSAAIKGQFIGRKLKRRTINKRRQHRREPIIQYGFGVRKFAQRVLDNIRRSQHTIVVDRPTTIVSGQEGAFEVIPTDLIAIRAKVLDRSSQEAVQKILQAPLIDMTKSLTVEDVENMSPQERKNLLDKIAIDTCDRNLEEAGLIFRKSSNSSRTVEKGTLKGENDDEQS